jgi:hypothetical protein
MQVSKEGRIIFPKQLEPGTYMILCAVIVLILLSGIQPDVSVDHEHDELIVSWIGL